MNGSTSSNSGQNYGILTVSVSTADGLIPVPGAEVTVSLLDGNGATLIRQQTTDRSGRTENFMIAAPPASESTSPESDGGSAAPYTKVLIEVSKEGFYSNQYNGALIFPGIVTIQKVYMIPIPEGAPPTDDTVYYESGGNDL